MAQSLLFVVKDIDAIIESEVGRYMLEVQETARRAYRKIVFDSPVMTGYYQTNHSIVVRNESGQFKTQGARLSPGIKDTTERLAFIGNMDTRMAQELEKLVEFSLGDSVEISTIVPYADSVEQNHNVYGSAAAQFGLDEK